MNVDKIPKVGCIVDLNRFANDTNKVFYNVFIGDPRPRAQFQMTEDATIEDLNKLYRSLKRTLTARSHG